MFSETIKESENLSAIKPLANGSRLTREWLDEAKRVGRERIIIKAHFRDTLFLRNLVLNVRFVPIKSCTMV